MRLFKLISLVLLISIGVIAAINHFDSEKSQNLINYESKKSAHSKRRDYTHLKIFIDSLSTVEELKQLRSDLNPNEIQCFISSTCSDKNYNSALDKAQHILTTYKSLSSRFQNTLDLKSPVGISANSNMSGSNFFSLNSILQLKILEVNLLFSKTNSDLSYSNQAIEKALLLDSFIEQSLKTPNLALTTTVLLNNLYFLRESLQKNAHRTVSVPKVTSDLVIRMLQIGEFITFSNTLQDMLKEEFKDRLLSLFLKRTPSVLISLNRTLNLYVHLSQKNSQADCVKNTDIKDCREIKISRFHPINPIGRLIAPMVIPSPFYYQKIVKLSDKINALNL